MPSISDDKDNVMRENHIVDDNPDNDINTPSLSKQMTIENLMKNSC